MKGNKKRIAAAAVIVGTAAALSLTANAEISLEKAYDIQEGSFIDGSNMLKMEGDSGYYVTSMDGKIKSQPLYGRSIYNEYGMLTVMRNVNELNNAGALNQNGQEMIPTKYGDIKVLNDEWALGIVLKEATSDQYDYENLFGDTDTYYLIDTVDVYHVENGVATCLSTLPRENFMDAIAYDSYINIKNRADGVVTTYDSSFQKLEPSAEDLYEYAEGTETYILFRENGQEGIKDSEGTIILEPSFNLIYDFQFGYAEVDTGEKIGLIDEQGNIVIEPLYDSVERVYSLPYDNKEGCGYGYSANGYFAVEQEGKLGYVDAQGNITMEPKYSSDALELNGASALLTDLEGNLSILAADGTETLVEGYERVSVFYYGSGIYYKVQNADYQEGMIDWHGTVVIPCENADIMFSGDGKYVLVDKEFGDGSAVIYKVPETASASEAPSGQAQAPANDASAEQTETPAEDTPAQQTEATATDAPAQQTETPATDAPAQQTETPATDAPAQQTETPAADAPAQQTETPAADAPAQQTEATAEDTSANAASAKKLLESASVLLDSDSTQTRESVKILVQQAAAGIEGENEAAVLLLENVILLLETEGSDAASIKTLLASAESLL